MNLRLWNERGSIDSSMEGKNFRLKGATMNVFVLHGGRYIFMHEYVGIAGTRASQAWRSCRKDGCKWYHKLKVPKCDNAQRSLSYNFFNCAMHLKIVKIRWFSNTPKWVNWDILNPQQITLNLFLFYQKTKKKSQNFCNYFIAHSLYLQSNSSLENNKTKRV